MKQATLELNVPTPDISDRQAFDIGWDHAHHGLVPPPELLHGASPVYQGWLAARAVFGLRTLRSRHNTRQWLGLRLRAWREGAPFDDERLTAHHLGQLQTSLCPLLRTPLGGVAGSADEAVLERLNPAAAYVAGNLVLLSARASELRRGVSLQQAVRNARQAESTGQPVSDLAADVWWRMAALASYGQSLTFLQACRLPMAAMPPNRVRLLNSAQGLQALLSRSFLETGWAGRCRALANLLPEHTWRLDFNLLVGALAPRVLEAPAERAARRQAVEDAWLNDRVQRRWQHLMLCMGEVAVQQLLERALLTTWPGVQACDQEPASVEIRAGAAAGSTRPASGLPGWPSVHRGTNAIRRVQAAMPSAGRNPARPGTDQPPAAPASHV